MSVFGAGLSMALFVGLFAYGGLELDQALGSSPWCLISGTMLGFVASFYHLVRTYAPEMLPSADKRNAASKARQAEGTSPDGRPEQTSEDES